MRKILIIEDNEMNREILSDILSEEYEVLEAENGAEGLALLEQNHRDLSVILLDLQMPVMDGFEFLSRVKDDALLSAVPVIVMTADENADTEARCMELGAVEFLEKPYNPVIIYGRIRNMVHMREAAAEIEAIEYDELTGLYTKQAFYHYMEKLLKENPEKDYTLLVTDIREFKLINSVYGEQAGDRVLCAIAESLRKNTRENGGIAGRYGADRFLALFDAEIVPSVAELEEELSCRIKIDVVDQIRLKMGVYEQVDHNLKASRSCDRAIGAMELVKESNDRNVGAYDGPLEQRHRMEQQMEADFPQAVEDGEFEAWFQPKVDPVRNQIIGAEALVRWRKEDGSYRAPYLFIPLFERDGLVADLDICMFRLVCQQQVKWKEAGIRQVPVSVNMSRTTLLRPGTVEIYRKMVEESGVPIELVPIEITESAAFLSNQIGERMKSLKAMGFALHMDDFGSGYSSLTSLGILPFDVTKIDKSLADNIGTDRGAMILRHMMAMIHELGMKAVAEGVESADQVEFLKMLGCDAIQGYYYSKPVPAAEFTRMLKEGI